MTSLVGSGTGVRLAHWPGQLRTSRIWMTAHKDQLFLAYPRGSPDVEPGDLMVYTSTVALFGLGDEITGDA